MGGQVSARGLAVYASAFLKWECRRAPLLIQSLS